MLHRKRYALALSACALAMLPATAQARHHVIPVQRPPLPQPMPQIVKAPCPGLPDVAGCHVGVGEMDMNGTVWPTGAVFTTGDRFTTAHELGHAFDETMMDAPERTLFARLIDRDDLLWTFSYQDENGAVIQDPRAPAEIFGDAYANCRLGHVRASGHPWEAGYNYYPSAKRHRRICRMITRAGRDKGTPVSADGDR